uniref:EF-hand domain-containing protein n=2 Tax=Haptolina brevifila TaxID=156173 RepID=A0A7S2HP56_9EUKA|mmetsp:Transcript_56479/g.112116  ORF Transcript_56479/g.112116 Transcript_56479/m.112116 type:complete len:614 (+) Transcript_56479:77-1918(+)|eukprot:CAMPEP_0174705234 /NCGR_PEP_ID=MMETSP1094-20130205/8533_1 /TAXON_ID=156173 /ORGANISM="Chrysochromulina brevifilum, Strain UTEX LB 985" /LENGTH=613 /DNA_ID=CAMNT_0015903371 /DNA_START=63 /DNA_END=1904 /DNA_ORIENTATION=+
MGAAIASGFIPPGSLLGCEEGPPAFAGGEPEVTCLAPSFSSDWIWGMVQCLTLLLVYAYVLFTASNMLSEGSELLLLVPSLANLVGSIVLPILGAVPDGAIMLFSGLGPGAQEQLSVGVGALAGSTIMLLTIPWGLCIIVGAVGLGKDGVANYSIKKSKGMGASEFLEKKMGGGYGQGVSPGRSISVNAKIMLATALIYLVIQGPALPWSDVKATDEVNKEIAKVEQTWSLIGLCLGIGGFCIYLVLMVYLADDDDEVRQEKVDNAIKKEVDKGSAKILTIITPMILKWKAEAKDAKAEVLLSNQDQINRFRKVLEPHFSKYDIDGDNSISADELPLLLKDLGAQDVTKSKVKEMMEKFDTDRSGDLDKKETAAFVLMYVLESGETATAADPEVPVPPPAPVKNLLLSIIGLGPKKDSAPVVQELEAPEAEEEEEEEDEAEMPEEFAHLTPDEQQRGILKQSFTMMGLGTVLILIFSDPMVDVLNNVGQRVGVPGFYVSFILAPLASNASELIASITYAKKKTKKTITVGLSALEGAACMNNTFCLSIFMGLIYFKGLAWKFTAETLAILIVQVFVGSIAMFTTMTKTMAYFILALFPLSIILIAWLEANGID